MTLRPGPAAPTARPSGVGKEGLHDGRGLHNRDDLQPAATAGTGEDIDISEPSRITSGGTGRSGSFRSDTSHGSSATGPLRKSRVGNRAPRSRRSTTRSCLPHPRGAVFALDARIRAMFGWWLQRDSNPRFGLERAVSRELRRLPTDSLSDAPPQERVDSIVYLMLLPRRPVDVTLGHRRRGSHRERGLPCDRKAHPVVAHHARQTLVAGARLAPY